MKLVRTERVPIKSLATIAVRDSADKPVAEVFEWLADNLRGTVWWSKTQFSDPSLPGCRRHYSSRQKHFKDGYWVYYFYFSLKADAAKFVLVWGRLA